MVFRLLTIREKITAKEDYWVTSLFPSLEINISTVDSMYIAVDHDTILNTLQEQKSYNFVQTSELTKTPISHLYRLAMGCLYDFIGDN